jgi:glycosyltransferase involved in cell wall biosynthesis
VNTSFKKKNIAIHFHIPAHIKGDNIYYPEYYGVWIDSLAGYFNNVYCLSYVHGQTNENNYKIQSENVKIINFGKKKRLIMRILMPNIEIKMAKMVKNEIDIFLCRAPTPIATKLLEIYKDKDDYILLVANMLESTKTHKGKIAFFKYWLWQFYWKYDHNKLQKIANRATTMTNGPIFKRQFNKIHVQHEVFTSTIHEQEIVKDSKKINKSKKIQVLVFGRLSVTKGIDVFIKAAEIIKNSKNEVNIEFCIAGGGDDYYTRELKELVHKLGLVEYFLFIGYVSGKESIFNIFDSADIFVIPARYEIQPRTMWEAMARGLPIICSTGVLSPEILFNDNDMLFFENENKYALARRIVDLSTNLNLYNKLSRRSIEIASTRTIELSAKLQLKLLLSNR